MIELLCGFIGLLAHSLLSISQARRRVKKYGFRDYWREYPYALCLAALVLIVTYIVGMYHIQQYFDYVLPRFMAEYFHEIENDELMWIMWGGAAATLAKWYGTKNEVSI